MPGWPIHATRPAPMTARLPPPRGRTTAWAPPLAEPIDFNALRVRYTPPRFIVPIPKSRRIIAHMITLARRYASFKGLYRIFNSSEYRFYIGVAAPPVEGATPLDTNATLPHTPADTFDDGPLFCSLSFFNGVIDSGFLPIGVLGETYLRLDVASNVEFVSPPAAPVDCRLEALAGGVVRIHAFYIDDSITYGAKWAIKRTFDGSTPAVMTEFVSPDITVDFIDPFLGGANKIQVLQFDLPAQTDGTTVKVRLQVTNSFESSFSEGSTVKTITADAVGPTAPKALTRWRGRAPEDIG